MRIPDIGFPQDTHPTTYEFFGWARDILNEGRYQLRILGAVPDWTTNDGEMVCVSMGDTRALYVFIYDGWYRLSWQQGKGGQYKTIIFYYAGVAKTGTSVSSTIFMPVSGIISRAWAYSDVAPTGSSMILDITKNATSIWNLHPSDRLTIAAGAYTGATATFDTTEYSKNDYFRLDIDQVGSTVPGSDLTVGLEIQE